MQGTAAVFILHILHSSCCQSSQGKQATCAGCRLHLEAQGRRNYAQSYALVSFMGMMLENYHHHMGHMLTHSEARWNLALNSQHFHHVDLAVN